MIKRWYIQELCGYTDGKPSYRRIIHPYPVIFCRKYRDRADAVSVVNELRERFPNKTFRIANMSGR